MRTKTIKIPIYGGRLVMIINKDLQAVCKKYNVLLPHKNCDAATFRNDTDYIVAFTGGKDFSNIAHEIVHIKNQIYLDCAMELDRYNDEPEAYLTGWLFDTILSFLKK